MTIEGQGSFRFAKNTCRDLEVSLTAAERTSVEIGDSAFENATLTAFPIDKITKVGSRGLSGAKLLWMGQHCV